MEFWDFLKFSGGGRIKKQAPVLDQLIQTTAVLPDSGLVDKGQLAKKLSAELYKTKPVNLPNGQQVNIVEIIKSAMFDPHQREVLDLALDGNTFKGIISNIIENKESVFHRTADDSASSTLCSIRNKISSERPLNAMEEYVVSKVSTEPEIHNFLMFSEDQVNLMHNLLKGAYIEDHITNILNDNGFQFILERALAGDMLQDLADHHIEKPSPELIDEANAFLGHLDVNHQTISQAPQLRFALEIQAGASAKEGSSIDKTRNSTSSALKFEDEPNALKSIERYIEKCTFFPTLENIAALHGVYDFLSGKPSSETPYQSDYNDLIDKIQTTSKYQNLMISEIGGIESINEGGKA